MDGFLEIIVRNKCESFDFIKINSLDYKEISKIKDYLNNIYSEIMNLDNIKKVKSENYGYTQNSRIRTAEAANYTFEKSDLDGNLFCCGFIFNGKVLEEMGFPADKIIWTIFNFISQTGWKFSSASIESHHYLSGVIHYFFARQ